MTDTENPKVAVVTGAGSGIGRAVALELAAAGWSVALAGRRAEALEETVRLAGGGGLAGDGALAGDGDRELVGDGALAGAGALAGNRALVGDGALAGGGSGLLAVPTDVTDPADVAALFSAARDRFGRVDLLFNNAGTFGAPGPLEGLAYEDWRSVVDVNLNGAFLCAQAAFRAMKDQSPQGGRIINNGSISAHVPRPHSIAYTATKHAMTGLTKSLSLDGRPYNIACGQLDIGNAATEMTGRMQTGILQANGELAVEPVMDAADVARTVVHMAALPLEANVQFATVMATGMPYIGRG
ncbi:SDR family oxidoreductase [Streptomyces ochraceiscleroticus]|uniref:SDR family oxidoreductase n=1 Tax=Streptomyces ochraceiscleroticus TaxID=47761 RepID=A0ABW1MEU2_9ACTN|nr:SDR family oxidoreductase [Streptomyces ochraceiscleroticus]